MKTTFPVIQNMHENAGNHEDPSNHDDPDDHDNPDNHYDNSRVR